MRFLPLVMLFSFFSARAEAGIILETVVTRADLASTSNITIDLFAGSDSGADQNVATYNVTLNINSLMPSLNGSVVQTFAGVGSDWRNKSGGGPLFPFGGGSSGSFAGGIAQFLGNAGTIGGANALISAYTPGSPLPDNFLGRLAFTVNRPLGSTLNVTLTPVASFQEAIAVGVFSPVSATIAGANLSIPAQTSAVPEPCTFGLLALGCVAGGWYRRRRVQ